MIKAMLVGEGKAEEAELKLKILGPLDKNIG